MIAEKEDIKVAAENRLFPIFLKLEELSLLIIGGGNVAFEKLNAVLNNSPQTKIKLVGIEINNAIKTLAERTNNLELSERAYTTRDIEQADIVIAAVNDFLTSEQIKNESKEIGKLVNVADKPGLCDFYLGSIVKKGSVKIDRKSVV